MLKIIIANMNSLLDRQKKEDLGKAIVEKINSINYSHYQYLGWKEKTALPVLLMKNDLTINKCNLKFPKNWETKWSTLIKGQTILLIIIPRESCFENQKSKTIINFEIGFHFYIKLI